MIITQNINKYGLLQILDLVLKVLTSSNSNEKENALFLLEEEIPIIKQIAISFKKTTEKTSE